MHLGKNESLSETNGGAIANTGFIVGEESVLVIDAGPSYLYALEMIKFIRETTNADIKYLVVTHHHPDHSFGLSKFLDIGSKVIISETEFKRYMKYGNRLLSNMKHLMGEEWFKNTQISEFEYKESLFPLTIDLGKRKINIRLYEDGHSGGDLLIDDINSNIIFVGDLVFNDRAPTIPHANISNWSEYLEEISNSKWSKLIPGHGPIIKNRKDIDLTKKWIKHIHSVAMDSVNNGISPAEVLEYGVPKHLSNIKFAEETWYRDVQVLMKRYENDN